MSSQTSPAAPSHGGDSAFSVGRGMPTPLGALHTGEGVNFALFSRHATAISLHLFQGERGPTLAKIDLDPRLNRTGDIWHVQVSHPTAEVYRDLHYLWSAGGPNDPGKGFYYDLSRPLLDPYALALSGGENWGKPDLARENTPDAPPISQRRCRLVNLHSFDWENDIPPDIPIENTVIYELHVRGYTVHPGSGVVNPGTFIGLCEKIPYLRELGITAVELMPVFEFDENENMRRAPDGSLLLNYWGYSPISFFCPNASFAASPNNAGAVGEFRQMVKKFHQAGIEVYLDVVFNHTAEGDERGPTISFRGLDNPIYYMLDSGGRYRNFSGCGNTMNCNHPLVRSFILDVLRYWVAFMHVDGFRFDLASILGRSPEGEALVNPPVLEMIAMDPILARTKLIAEAWDAAGLNQVGNFPSYRRWAEWNGYYRDDVRCFWRGDSGFTSRMASRVCGSDDLYLKSGRSPGHSINFLTAHDGFTLNDLVSYSQKHNQANGENNQDGESHNHSENFGVEGPSGDQTVREKRRRQTKNLLATLFLSQGVPMLLAGDEFARTQQGNNNAYCQDNPISWVNWELVRENGDLLRFVRLMIKFRHDHPSLRRSHFFHGQGGITWHGERENEPDWSDEGKCLAFLLDGGQAKREKGDCDDDVFVALNAADNWRHVTVPGRGREWLKMIDTSRASPEDIIENPDQAPRLGQRIDRLAVEPRSLLVLINPRG